MAAQAGSAHHSRPRKETIHLTPYTSFDSKSYGTAGEPGKPDSRRPWISADPRSSSTQSLVPSRPTSPSGQRTLLLIYLHGFLGNEASFQSFPAHVHNLLKLTLAETHRVHTKIYPRYKSRRAIEFARDDFSKWLTPHEAPDTDVVLLGHSMGGILAAEITLLPPRSYPSDTFFRHRVLGTINFDTPFLGMHPGVIVSGIGSLFRPAPERPSVAQRDPNDGSGSFRSASSERTKLEPSRTGSSSIYATQNRSSEDINGDDWETRSAPPEADPDILTPASMEDPPSPFAPPSTTDLDYNPPYENDIRIPMRKGWESTLHFISKHSDGLTRATRQYFTSHLEFGGCLADYPGLRARYAKIRALEDVKGDGQAPETPGSVSPPRVRFVNYYTTSTGRIKPAKSATVRGQEGDYRVLTESISGATLSQTTTQSSSTTPRVSVEEERDGRLIPCPVDETDYSLPASDELISSVSKALSDLRTGKSQSRCDDRPEKADPTIPPSLLSSDADSTTLSLPPIPPPLPEPPFFDPSQYHTKEARKRAEKEHAAVLKTYKHAVKERNRLIKHRTKQPALLLGQPKSSSSDHPLPPKAEPKERDKSPAGRQRRFCVLPPRINGRPDPTWVPVGMHGVDEVEAHCSLFFLSETYERLVGDVAARIEEWIRGE